MGEASDDLRDLVFRRARAEDVPRIVALILRGAPGVQPADGDVATEALHPDYALAFADIESSPDNTLFVAERDGEVIGTFQLTLIPGLIARGRKRAKLESVHVASACRGGGVGGRMVRFALDEARARGAGLVELTSNKARADAHRFYRRLGFEQSHEGFKYLL